MQPYLRGLCWGLALALVAGGFLPAVSAQETKPAIRIALVDIARVNAEFNQLAQKRGEMQQWFQQQKAYLAELEDKYSYLSEQHFNEILDILRMPRPLKAEAATRREELRDLNDEKEARFLELRAKVDRSAKEQDEFNQLLEIAEARARQIDTIRQGLQTQLAQRQDDAQAQVITAMEQAVREVAAAGGYHVVLNKVFVLYGGEDITDAVLEKLNGQAPARPAATEPTPAPPGGGQ